MCGSQAWIASWAHSSFSYYKKPILNLSISLSPLSSFFFLSLSGSPVSSFLLFDLDKAIPHTQSTDFILKKENKWEEKESGKIPWRAYSFASSLSKSFFRSVAANVACWCFLVFSAGENRISRTFPETPLEKKLSTAHLCLYLSLVFFLRLWLFFFSGHRK